MFTTVLLSSPVALAWGFGPYATAWRVSDEHSTYIIRKGDGKGTPGLGRLYQFPGDTPRIVRLDAFNIITPDTSN